MNEAVETIEFKKGGKRYRILLKYDEFPEDPRTMSGDSPMGLFLIPKSSQSSELCDEKWDSVVDRSMVVPLPSGKIPFFHGDPEDALEPSVEDVIGIWPLGRGDHGPGTTQLYLGSGPLACDPGGWDSGQVGWVFATAKVWKTWQLTDWEDTPENQKHLREIVESELEEFACYVRGCCYRYEFERFVPQCDHGHGDEWTDADGTFDGCGGYIGEYPTFGGAVEDACEAAGIACPAKYKERKAVNAA